MTASRRQASLTSHSPHRSVVRSASFDKLRMSGKRLRGDEMGSQVTMEKLVSLSKRRGFVFQSSEIYGGIGGFWDYGPLGVELKNNIKRNWWRAMVQLRDDVVGIETSIVMNPRVWEASGHIQTFADPMVDCK